MEAKAIPPVLLSRWNWAMVNGNRAKVLQQPCRAIDAYAGHSYAKFLAPLQ